MPRIFKLSLHRHSGIVQSLKWPVFDTTGNYTGFEPVSRTDNLTVVDGGAKIAAPNVFHGLNYTAPLFVCADSSGTALDNVNHIMSYGFERIFIDQILSDEYFELPNGSTIKVSATRDSTGYQITCKYYNSANEQCYPDFVLNTTLLWQVTSMLFLPFCADLDGGNYNLLPLMITRVNLNTPYLRFDTQSAIAPRSADLGRSFWEGYEPIDVDDPYQDIPDSEPSGPAEGSGIPGNDPVDIPGLPTVSVTDTGFVGLFNPTLGQVQNLADYMWTGLFDINTFKKIFADPMDCILGFNMVPVDVPSGSAAAVRVGNISTGVQMNVATSQWVEVDCGSLTLDLPYGSYLDYAPYSKFSLYLPYIGIVELSTDDVVGKTLVLKYHVDVLSCSCVAFLKCGDSVLYQFTGSCGYSIPLTGDSFKQTVANVVSIAATVGGVVASGGISAPAAVAAGASITSNVMNSKPEIHRSGSIGSSAGLLGIQTPYLIMELPHACKPKKQYHYLGYPGFITAKIGDISGYAEFESVILDGIGCTSEERQLIESYCSGGIYV